MNAYYQIIKNKPTVPIFFVFLVLIIIARFDAFTLAPYWDALGQYIPYTYTMYENTFLLNLKWTAISVTHPPFYFLIVTAITKVFGWNLIVLRVICFITAAFFLLGVYKVSCTRLPKSVSFCLGISLLFSPLILSESAMLQADLPMSTFFIWCTYFMIQKKYVTSSFFFMFSVLSNATAIILTPAIIYFLYSLGLKKIKDYINYFLPVFVFSILWIFYSIHLQGLKLGGDPDTGNAEQYFKQSFFAIFKRFAHRVMQIFFIDLRFIFSVPIFILLAQKIKYFKSFSLDPLYLYFLLILIIESIFLTLFGVTHHRYFIVAIPGLIIFGTSILLLLLKNSYQTLNAILIAMAIAGFYIWHQPPNKYTSDEYRSTYRTHVNILQKATNYLEDKHIKTTIYSNGFLGQALSRPFLLYTSKKLNVVNLDENKINTPEAGSVFAFVYEKIGNDSYSNLAAHTFKNRFFKKDCTKILEYKWIAEICMSNN